MSSELSRSGFAQLQDEYLRGELPPERRLACDRFLELHPEVQPELDELRAILACPAWVAAGDPPAGLLARANDEVRQRLLAPSRAPARATRLARVWRPALAWSFVAAVLVVGAVTFWPSGAPLVFADVVARLQEISSLQVEGWIRGEDGQQVPYRQWLLADGTLRAEVGPPDRQRVVVRRAGERRVLDEEGRLFRLTDVARRHGSRDDLALTLRHLEALYDESPAAAGGGELTREDLGRTTRFTRRAKASLGGGPGRLQWTIEVDKDTALPVTSSLHEMIEGAWVRMSELRFTAIDLAPPAEAFELKGDALPMDEHARERLWFELGISPGSIQVPAVAAPVGDSDVAWFGPDDLPEGMTGGGSTNFDGGVTTFEMHNLGLGGLVGFVSGHAVVDNPSAQQRVSLRLRARTALPWQRQLAPVLEHLRLNAEVIRRPAPQRRFEFRQDGRALSPSRHENDFQQVHADRDGYRYRFERIPLRHVVNAMMGNSTFQWAPHDSVAFAGDATGARSPFDVEVDASFHNPGGVWETNLQFLNEQFGVTVQVVADTVDVREILLVSQN